MPDPMWSCRAKLDWAEMHFHRLAREVAEFSRIHPYSVVPEGDTDALCYHFRISGLHSPPSHWGLIIGDCVHNARAALDHLTYALAATNGGLDVEIREAGLAFPVLRTLQSFKSWIGQKGKRGLLRSEDWTRIEQLQPFNAMNPQIWPGVVPGFPAEWPGRLFVLSELDNADKHNVLNVVWYGVSSMVSPPVMPDPFKVTGFGASGDVLTDDAIIGHWFFDTLPVELPPDMDVNRYFPIEPRLDRFAFLEHEGLVVEYVWALLPELQRCLHTVASLLNVFEPSVIHGQPPLSLRHTRTGV